MRSLHAMDSSKFVTSFAKKNIFAQFFKQVEYTGVKQNKCVLCTQWIAANLLLPLQKKNILAQFFKQVEYTGVKQNKDKQDFHSNILSLQGFLKCSSSAL